MPARAHDDRGKCVHDAARAAVLFLSAVLAGCSMRSAPPLAATARTAIEPLRPWTFDAGG
ncbi:MAG TPA: hypothetical protein VFW15_15230 [Thermoanaerobaculia bacterium]|nr:hypothetical protein [Thermoanaerobaculia bacterium]